MSHQKTAVIDFDNTLSGYDHWRGPYVMGPPVPYAREAVQELLSWGWRVVIFTTRKNVGLIQTWLMLNNFPELEINTTDHNPPDTSNKPIAEVYFDDRDAHCVGTQPYNWHRAMARVRRLYQPLLNYWWETPLDWQGIFHRWFIGPWRRRQFRRELKGILDSIEGFMKC